MKITNRGPGSVHVAVDVTGWFATMWGASGGTLSTIDPLRVTGTSAVTVGGGSSVDVQVAGEGEIPAGDVSSVVATLSVSGATVEGPVVVYSSDEVSVPSAVSVWASADGDRSSLVTVPVGADGKVRVHNGSTAAVDVDLDVVGWVSGGDPSNPDGGAFRALTPEVVFYDENVTGGVGETFAVSTPALLAAEVEAVALSVTVDVPDADGTAVLWPSGESKPADAVAISFEQGVTTATATVVVPYDETGEITFESTADVVVRVDLVGWWFGARTTWAYGYSPDGIRLSKTGPAGSTVNYRWDHASGLPLLLSETYESDDGNFEIRYLYGPGGRAVAYDSPFGMAVLHADQLGSIRAVTALDAVGYADGDVVARYSYDAWGRQIAVDGEPNASRMGYAGEYTDRETGYVYLRARFYDPATATFLTRDPNESITRDAYGYANNSPHNYTDPSGLCGWSDPWNCADNVVDIVAEATPDCFAWQDGCNSIISGATDGRVCSALWDEDCTAIKDAHPWTWNLSVALFVAPLEILFFAAVLGPVGGIGASIGWAAYFAEAGYSSIHGESFGHHKGAVESWKHGAIESACMATAMRFLIRG